MNGITEANTYGHLLCAEFFYGNIVDVDLRTNKKTIIATGFRAADGLAQGHDGTIYVSSFDDGRVWKMDRDGENPQILLQDVGFQTTADLAALVTPFSGTQPGGPDFGTGGGAENTFPGADVPFGMVQWSPDTMRHQDGGYYYPDNRIKGFSLTHFSGAGCSAAEDIPFLPFVGQVTTSPATDLSPYVSTFSHDREAASPGYYGVTLDSGPTMELTTTPRSGMGRITYPITNQATLLVNVSGSVNGVTDAQVDVGPNTLSGLGTSR